MLNPKTRRFFQLVLPFVLFWQVGSLVYLFLEKGLLGDLDYYPNTGNPYDFMYNSIILLTSATIVGFLVGSFEILYLKKKFLNAGFGVKLFGKSFIYAGIMIIFLLVNAIISNMVESQLEITDPILWDHIWIFLTSFSFWSVEIYIALLMGLSLFYAEVSDNMGPQVLNNFLLGKYHHPLEEERIFMFLDMKSSTTIAERLGHIQYFELLQDYYEDISEPILLFEGEVYQYVGDEIVISWLKHEGLHLHNCIQCFFEMRKALASKQAKYEKKFGIVPTFKAGLHLGKVTAGEIGVLKQDIVFTGDVLNTTARIQSLCNDYNSQLLISESLLQLLPEMPYSFRSVGDTSLRGKNNTVEIFTLVES